MILKIRILIMKALKFLSSVRLAIPLLIIIACAVAAGTLYESRYNAEVAKIMVYRSTWFEGLLILLWLNIFCATLSRYPFKRHHIGFVITHIGLLTLLIGAQITAFYGLDGQLQIHEGQESKAVFLPNLILKISGTKSGGTEKVDIKIPVERALKTKSGAELGLAQITNETGLSFDHYMPFVTVSENGARVGMGQSSANGGTELSFNLQSQFFNVSQSLSTQGRKSMQLGPATIMLIEDRLAEHSEGEKFEPSLLIAKDGQNGEELGHLAIEPGKTQTFSVKKIKVHITKAFQHAVVAGGKLAEGEGGGDNPALELQLESKGKIQREVVFTKFPTFSLNKTAPFGLRFEYQSHGTDIEQGAGAETPERGNIIEFHVAANEGHANQSRIVLRKNGQQVLSKIMPIGEPLQTPWMGMKITIQAISDQGNAEESIRPTEMQPRKPLPPSAIFLGSDSLGEEGGQGVWIVEGKMRSFTTSRGSFDVYYGQESVDLPFSVKLDQFTKLDYPGTNTPMSFESMIRISEAKNQVKIKMNEPFEQNGYVLYQSGYEQPPGNPAISIFSVNRDPGRAVKYVGAVILILGIALFTWMRSSWYTGKNRRHAFNLLLLALLVTFGARTSVFAANLNEPEIEGQGFPSVGDSGRSFQDFTPNAAQENFTHLASKIDPSEIVELPVQNRGRIKPLDTLARETNLYIFGKYSLWGLQPIQVYVGLMASNATPYLEVINIRDPELRVKLGFSKSQRYVSLQQLKNTELEKIASPLMEKQDEKSMTQEEKQILELAQQAWLFRDVLTGQHFRGSILLMPHQSATDLDPRSHYALAKADSYLMALQKQDFPMASTLAFELISAVKNQSMPDLFQKSMGSTHLEVQYNKARPFFWVGILYLLFGTVLLSGLVPHLLSPKRIVALACIPIFMHIFGFLVRVSITGFAPVTNMYGTMIWVAFGVVAFGTAFFLLYRNSIAYGLLLVGASLVLLLTESIPLILSPDMDPIVAVLRNNFWLTIHVLTISISYAAFTIAMLIGNTALIQTIFKRNFAGDLKHLAHLAYRATQLGVFLLTTGIILGGWWADYSWGRFWGWDPKETWALIADIGFLVLLHARYASWLGAYGLLASTPIAYLLVIMAWYGVNFILATGLHSYGFSSGGAAVVVSFVIFQLALSCVAFLARQFQASKELHMKQ